MKLLPKGYRRMARPGLFSNLQQRVVVPGLQLADNPLRRMVGLLGRKGMAEGSGLLIVPCSGIHMFFMRFAIDAVFLDRWGGIMKIVPQLGVWRMAHCRGAKAVLELPAGAAEKERLQEGDVLVLKDQDAL